MNLHPPSCDEPGSIRIALGTANDAQLIDACLAGNELGWEALMNRYGQLVYTIPRRFGFSEAVADEMFQETWLTLLEKLDTLHEPERVKPWLVTVARRACIQHMRDMKKVSVSTTYLDSELSIANPFDDRLIMVERQVLVRHALENLDEECRKLLSMLFLEDSPPPIKP